MTGFDAVGKLLLDSFPQLFWPALTTTLPLAVASFVAGLALALLLAVVRLKRIAVLDPVARVYIWLVRGTPLLVQLFVIFFGLPSVGILIDPWPAAFLALTFNVAAYGAENLRGALEAVSRGQWAAARSLGLTEGQTLRHVVIPQALRAAVPTLGNQFVSLIKDTSLASTVTVTEMFLAAQQIAARTYEPLWLYLEAGAVYLILCTAANALQSVMERRLYRYRAA